MLSGGRYDGLMRKMGRRSGGIGFAVYLDALERADEKAGADSGYINVALPKGRLGAKRFIQCLKGRAFLAPPLRRTTAS